MKIGTYNTYFAPEFYAERLHYQIQSLSDCDLICLQEIRSDFLELVEEYLEEFGFVYSLYAIQADYGILTASKVPFDYATKIFFQDSQMGRGFIHVMVNDVSIINTHLESMYQFQAVRNKQIKQMVDYCLTKHISPNTLICGDLNCVFPKIYHLDLHFTPQVDFSTWFLERTVEYQKTKKGKKNCCRFDRIYTGKNLSLTSKIEKVGDQMIEDLNCYPSDHDGLKFEIKLLNENKN